MAASADTLRQLHRIHRQLSDLRSRLERGPKQIRASEENITRLENELAEAKQQVQKTRMSADQKQLQLREREGRIADVRLKLNSCSTNREYQAFLEQIAADEQANSVLSDEILELFDKITEVQAAAAAAEKRVAKASKDLKSIRNRIDSERELLESDVTRLINDLSAAESRLPSDIRPDYDRVIKARGEEGLAPLEGECCGGCFQMITPQMINELTMGKPVFCKSCGCLMYMPEDQSANSD